MKYGKKAAVKHPAINDMECYGLTRFNARDPYSFGSFVTSIAQRQGEILPLELGRVNYFQQKQFIAELGESIIVRGGQAFEPYPDGTAREARIVGKADVHESRVELHRKLRIFGPLGGGALRESGIRLVFSDTEEEQDFMPFMLGVTKPNMRTGSYQEQGLALISAEEILKAEEVDDGYINRLSHDYIDNTDRRYGFDYGKHGKLESHRKQELAEAEAIEAANIYVTMPDGSKWIQYSSLSGLSYTGPDDLAGYYDV